MRSLALMAACVLAMPSFKPAHAELDPRPILVEPGVTAPGQPVQLRWYFTGTKVVISGGRFGKGLVVTGKNSISDRPVRTTKYTFDVWYKPAPDPAKPEVKPVLTHVTYNAVAAVDKLTSYRSSDGWAVRYLQGWRTDSFSPEPGSHVYYFQPEQDSVERLAVAVLPVKPEDTAAELMQKVRDDVPSHYTKVEFVSQYDVTHQRESAQLTTFRGIDQTHPNTRTQSVILAFIHHGHAYVVSARTVAARFEERQALLEGLVRSFALQSSTASAR